MNKMDERLNEIIEVTISKRVKGGWSNSKVEMTVAQAGKMLFHTREIGSTYQERFDNTPIGGYIISEFSGTLTQIFDVKELGGVPQKEW